MNIIIVQKWPVWLNDLVVKKHNVIINKQVHTIENDDTIIPETNMRCLPDEFGTKLDIALKAESIKCIHNTLDEIDSSVDILYFFNGLCADGTISKVDYIYFSKNYAKYIEPINDRKTAILLYEDKMKIAEKASSHEGLTKEEVTTKEKKVTTKEEEVTTKEEEVSPQKLQEVNKVGSGTKNTNEIIDLPDDFMGNEDDEQMEKSHESILTEKLSQRRKSIEPEDGNDGSVYQENYISKPTSILKNNKKVKEEDSVEEPSWLTEASTQVSSKHVFENFLKEYKTVIKHNGESVLELQGIIPPTVLSHLAHQRVTVPLTSNAVVMISGNKKVPKVSKWLVNTDTYDNKTHSYTAVDSKNVPQSSRQTYNTRSTNNSTRTKTINSLKKLHRSKR